MRKEKIGRILVLLFAFSGPYGLSAQQPAASADRDRDDIIALERSALDRWIKPDPQGYLDLYAPDVTYFDPTTDKRVDGQQAMQERLAPMKNAKLPAAGRRYEMIGPKVQRYGDVALLTFNLLNYGKLQSGPESVLARWNATEVYRRIDGRWRIVHSHWSFIKPEIKPSGR